MKTTNLLFIHLTRPFLLCGLLMMITAGATAADDEFPHAYPRSGVKALFENDRVFAWDVTWLRDVEQPYHRHRYDMAAVYLRFGPIRVTQLDGSYNPPGPPFAVPRPFFQGKGVTHKEEMIGFADAAPERWAIMFDLKDVSAKPLSPPTGLAPAFPREGAELAIENERVLEWVHGWETGKPLPAHMYTRDAVQVFYEPGSLSFTDAAGNTQTESFEIGDARFVPAGTIAIEAAVSGSPKAVTIELK
ncbi:MAG: hypothetical protein R3F41_10390 [Gammaproteobacteria bacterium]|nr:hypothetical protein [Pseudomonadales bacterium]MCP5348014.1 hypothetical protein [Pseudomonadales bacterium]